MLISNIVVRIVTTGGLTGRLTVGVETRIFCCNEGSSWLSHCATSRKVAGSILDGDHWDFSLTKSYRPHYGTGVDSAPNRSEYQGYLLGGEGGGNSRLTTLLSSNPDCPEILSSSPSCSPKDLYRTVQSGTKML